MNLLINNLRLLFFILIPLGNIVAQPAPALIQGRITGKVYDKQSNLPMEYATISLFTTDSSLVTGTISSKDGSFVIEAGPGNYFAEIQFISYEKKIISNISISANNRNADLGTITLEPEATSLDEVTVVGERSEMEINLDKKTFNVGKDLSNTGKTALDILDNIPSVAVDMDGNISLRGSGNIKILIDGKPSGMISTSNTDALQSLQGSMIEKVEVITNPSARYEAEGMAGIINIVLKKDATKGMNGTFEFTVGYPQEYSLGVNLNLRKEKINYFLNYNLRYNERPGEGSSYQEFTLSDTSYITQLTRERIRKSLSNRIRGGADYYINSKNTLTASFGLGFDNQNNNTTVTYQDKSYTDPDLLYFETIRTDNENENRNNFETSLNYEKKFNSDENKLTILTQFIYNYDREISDIEEIFKPHNENFTDTVYKGDTILQRSYNKEELHNYLIQADYVYPFGNDGKFETGYRSEFKNILIPYSVEEMDSNKQWNVLPEFTNKFRYIENIHALYVQGGNTFGRLGLQIGLRAELSDVRTYLYETDSTNERLYLDFFPTFHSSFQFNKIHSMQLSYSRRIQRPRFWLLNPFHSYSDSRNIRSGNPNLDPEYTNSVEAGYLANLKVLNFYSGIYYRYSTNVIERISTVIDTTGITLMSPYNLAERQSYGFESNMTFRIQKWLTLSGSFDFYRSITDGNFHGVSKHSDDYSWNTRFNSKLRLPKDIDVQTIFFYRAPQETTEGLRKAFYMLNMGISKDLFKGNATLTLNVQDLLNSRKFRFILDRPDLYSENEFRWSERSYTLTFVYRLNQKKRMGRNGRSDNNDNNDMGNEDMGF